MNFGVVEVMLIKELINCSSVKPVFIIKIRGLGGGTL